jgi:hypothetical protein
MHKNLINFNIMVVPAGINKLLYSVMSPYSMRDLHMNSAYC